MLFIIESIILCVAFTVMIVPKVLKDPLQQLFNYPPIIQERVKSIPEYKDRIPTNKKKLSVKIVAALVFAIILASIVYFSGVRTFWSAFLYAFGLFMVVNWFDAFVLDAILFCHDKRFRIPGTEDMVKEYESPWFHIIGGIKGTFIGMVVSIMVAGVIWLM
jgi:hypothetical protein